MQKKKSSLFMTVFDVLFVLVLCFIMLIAISVISKAIGAGTQSPDGYHISLPILIGAVASLVVYLTYMIRKTTGSLREFYDAASANVDNEEDA